MTELTFTATFQPQIAAVLGYIYPSGQVAAQARIQFTSQVKNGTDREAREWELGYTQTIIESKRFSFYVDGNNVDRFLRTDEIDPLPALDVEPWFKPEAPFRAFYTL